MPLDDIVAVTITTETAQVSKAGFGIPLIAAYHTNWTERVRTYSASTALSAMITEGFDTSDPAYLAMTRILGQSPRPKQVMIGRRDGVWTQIVRITPDSPDNLEEFTVEVDGEQASFTSDSSATLAEACTGIAAAINGLSGVDVTASGASGTYVDVTSDDPAILHTIKYVENKAKNFSILDVTAEQDIADDLNLIRAASDAWYGFVIDSCATSEIKDAAGWAEANRVIFVPNSSDTDIVSSSTSDLFSDLQDDSYARTIPVYHPSQDSFAGAAWLGVMLPYQPGEATWAYKTLRGVSSYYLSATEVANVKGKKGNYYTVIGGIAVTLEGWSSAGEYVDITVFVDWMTARIQERFFALLVNRSKLPYTDQSVDLVRAELLAQLQDGINVGGIAASPAPVVDAPLVSEVSANDRAGRLLPDISFSGTLAGAIHQLEIRGNLSV